MDNSTLLLALLAFFGWGTGDLFVAFNSRALGSFSAAIWRITLTCVFYTALLVFGAFSFQIVTTRILGIIAALTVVGILGIICFYEGMRRGKAVIAGAITSCFSAVVVILSIIFFSEQVTVAKIAATGIILIGIILTSAPLNRIQKLVTHDRGVPWAVAAMFLWGIFFTFVKIPSREIGPFLTGYLYSLSFLPILVGIMMIRRERIQIPSSRKTWLWVISQSIVITLAEVAYNTAVAKGAASLVAPLASSSPVLFVVLAFFFLRERITKQQLIGILLTLGGIVTLSFWG